MLRDGGGENALNFAAGDVASVDDPPRRVPALTREVERPFLTPGELCSELHQPANGLRSIFHAEVDDHVMSAMLSGWNVNLICTPSLVFWKSGSTPSVPSCSAM